MGSGVATNGLSLAAYVWAVPKMLVVQSLFTLAACALSRMQERQADRGAMDAIEDNEGAIHFFQTCRIILKI